SNHKRPYNLSGERAASCASTGRSSAQVITSEVETWACAMSSRSNCRAVSAETCGGVPESFPVRKWVWASTSGMGSTQEGFLTHSQIASGARGAHQRARGKKRGASAPYKVQITKSELCPQSSAGAPILYTSSPFFCFLPFTACGRHTPNNLPNAQPDWASIN